MIDEKRIQAGSAGEWREHRQERREGSKMRKGRKLTKVGFSGQLLPQMTETYSHQDTLGTCENMPQALPEGH